MDPPPPPPLLLALLLLLAFLASPSSVVAAAAAASSSLDPKQLTALQSMGISTAVDPCSPRLNSSVCDSSSPFRHLVSLSLTDCPSSLSFPSSALLSLSSLLSLSLLRCPSPSLLRRPLPSPLASNLRSFSSVSSSPQISGVWLSRLSNLTSLLVLGTPVRASAPFVFFSQMPHLANATVSGCNLSGGVPHHWNSPNLTHLDLSSNRLRGSVPNLIGSLSSLRKLNLSSNELNGTLPATVGDLVRLQEMSVSGNSISGPPPDKSDSSSSSSSSKSDASDYDDEGDGGDGRRKSGGGGHHGPSTLVLVVAIGLSCLGFLVVFAICISKCRRCCS